MVTFSVNPVTVASNPELVSIAAAGKGLNSCMVRGHYQVCDVLRPHTAYGCVKFDAGRLGTHRMLFERHAPPRQRTLVHPYKADVHCVWKGGAYLLLLVLAHHMGDMRSIRRVRG